MAYTQNHVLQWSAKKKNIEIGIYKFKNNTNTSDVIDLVIGSNADKSLSTL